MYKILIFILFIYSTTLFAQKNSQLIGGNFDISNFKEAEGDAFSINLQGSYGIFTADKFVLGSSINLDIQKYFRTKFGIGPYIRRYFYKIYNSPKVNMFAQYQFLWNRSKPNGYDAIHFLNNEITLGHTLFLSEKVALEGLLYYGNEKIYISKYNHNYWGFKIGFQYYLVKK